MPGYPYAIISDKFFFSPFAQALLWISALLMSGEHGVDFLESWCKLRGPVNVQEYSNTDGGGSRGAHHAMEQRRLKQA